MGGNVNFEEFFKTVKIKVSNEEMQFKILGNKVYADKFKSTGNMFEDMVLNSASWTIVQLKDSPYFDLVFSFDDRQFIEIFFNSEDDDIRKHALKRIENEFVLSYIAINDENEEIRWDAFNKVWKEDFLEDIALNSCDWELRLTIAQYYLKDAKILRKISRECPDFELRNRAREIAKELGPLSYASYGDS